MTWRVEPFNSAIPIPAASTGWKPLRVGAGGLILGMSMAPDGRMSCRCDTWGGFVSELATPRSWRQVQTSPSIGHFFDNPASNPGGIGFGGGLWDLVISPSSTSRCYMFFSIGGGLGTGLYRSNDFGLTWTETGYTRDPATDPNQQTDNACEHRIAVDPQNADVVFASHQTLGLFYSSNGGTSFSHLAGIPNGTTGNVIAFDPSSSVVSGKTQGIYCGVQGTGIYRSTDGGSTWTQLSTGFTGTMPTTAHSLLVGTDGTVYICERAGTDAANIHILRPATTVWLSVDTLLGADIGGIAIDPFNVNRVVAVDDGSATSHPVISISTNKGATWTGGGAIDFAAPNIPWLAQGGIATSCANIVFDTQVSNKLYLATGVGIFYCNPPSNPSSSTTHYIEDSTGIEQLVGNNLISVPGGPLMMTFWDRPLFLTTNPDAYPTTYYPNFNNIISRGFDPEYASDFATSNVLVVDAWGDSLGTANSALSSNAGSTWANFASTVYSGDPGSIAAVSASKIVIADGVSALLYQTQNGGSSWTQIASPVVGLNQNPLSLPFKEVCADRVNGNFYAYGTNGVFKSTNGGVSFSNVHAAFTPTASANHKIRAVPGNANNLFWCAGLAGGSSDSGMLLRSTDGGTTWTDPTNANFTLNAIWYVGFGMAKPGGGGYPAIFVLGWINSHGAGSVFGVYRSDDNCATWVKFGDGLPLGHFALPSDISGDMNVYGRCYILYNIGAASFYYHE